MDQSLLAKESIDMRHGEVAGHAVPARRQDLTTKCTSGLGAVQVRSALTAGVLAPDARPTGRGSRARSSRINPAEPNSLAPAETSPAQRNKPTLW